MIKKKFYGSEMSYGLDERGRVAWASGDIAEIQRLVSRVGATPGLRWIPAFCSTTVEPRCALDHYEGTAQLGETLFLPKVFA